jgi:hypothetical protein
MLRRNLGGYEDFLAHSFDSLTYDLLRPAAMIHLGRVNQVDAELKPSLQRSNLLRPFFG